MRFVIFSSFFIFTILFVVIFSNVTRHTYARKAVEQKVNYTINQSKVLLNQLVGAESD